MTRYGDFVVRTAVAVGLAALWPGLATAGPPFRTDDPEPVAYQHYEDYIIFGTGTHISGDTSGIGPAWEFNYGLIPNVQIHIIAPLGFNAPAGASNQFGYSDTELGVKYRFIQEDEKGIRPMVGVYPLLELPTGDQTQGLGAGHYRLFLPVWVQKSFGDWTTYGGGGYEINHGGGTMDQDFWFVGWLLQKKVTEKLTIGGEIFYQTAITIGGKDQTGFNIGAIYDFDEHNHLLVSVGTGIQNASSTNLYSWYLGYQITSAVGMAEKAPADMAVKAPRSPAAPVYGGTGWYVGGNVGYSWGHADIDLNGTGSFDFSDANRTYLDGVIGGGQIGYKYQFGPDSILGLEADIQGSGQRGGHTFFDPFSAGTAVTSYDAKINWFGTVRGRFGYSIVPQLLYYATGGLAFGQVETSGNTISPVGGSAFSASKTHTGFSIGGGIEGSVWLPANWTWRLEYLFLNLETLDVATSLSAAGGTTTHIEFTDNIVRVGLNYQFH